MYLDSVQAVGAQAAAKLDGQRQSLASHLARSVLAGMYVGAAIVLIFTIGGSLSQAAPHLVKLITGVCFGCALTFVIFAGSELFTGSNLVMVLGVLTGKADGRGLGSNWLWTWIGNLIGGVLIAVLVVYSGVLDADPIRSFVLSVAETKMTLPPGQLLLRAILANWLVCLAVWMAARTTNDAAKILLIWWCMFAFITSGYEHSVANMCGLMLGLLLPHEGFAGITWAGYGYNLALVTAGNIVGGAVFVGGMYWLGSSAGRARALADAAVPDPSPAMSEAAASAA